MPVQFGVTPRDLVLGERVGQGISGQVFKSAHPVTGQAVAVKIYTFDSHDEAFRARDRFWRECRVLSTVQHSALPALYGCGEEDERTGYAVMEWIEGKPLLEYRDAPLDVVLRLATLVLLALRSLHRKGFVHRDIAFDNILVEERRSGLYPRLIDFGAAKDLLVLPEITVPGSFLGRLQYAAPEAITAEGSRAINSAKADVFSFGVLLFEWLSGRLPFPGKDPGDFRKAYDRRKIQVLTFTKPRGETDPALAAFVHSLLDVDMEKRPDTEEALRRLLDVRRRIPFPATMRRVKAEEIIKHGAGEWLIELTSYPRILVASRVLDVEPEVGADIEDALEASLIARGVKNGEEPASVEEAPPPATISDVKDAIERNPWASRLFLGVSILTFLAACLFAALYLFRRS